MYFEILIAAFYFLALVFILRLRTLDWKSTNPFSLKVDVARRVWQEEYQKQIVENRRREKLEDANRLVKIRAKKQATFRLKAQLNLTSLYNYMKKRGYEVEDNATSVKFTKKKHLPIYLRIVAGNPENKFQGSATIRLPLSSPQLNLKVGKQISIDLYY